MKNFEISETRNCHSELIWLTLLNKKVPNFRIDIFCDTAPMTWPFLHLTNKKLFSHFESNFPTLFKTLNTADYNTYKANDDKKWRFALSHENSALSWISQRFTRMRRHCFLNLEHHILRIKEIYWYNNSATNWIYVREIVKLATWCWWPLLKVGNSLIVTCHQHFVSNLRHQHSFSLSYMKSI